LNCASAAKAGLTKNIPAARTAAEIVDLNIVDFTMVESRPREHGPASTPLIKPLILDKSKLFNP
jgi:hypothetical protein